ncbi:Smr/MutS family protein [Rhodobacter sp. SY28-1]|uniref:Smr/MutS family protein n=1 Tax=Rhodobacter sp. SY28-1 TaxID=2562317 RepID=UPI0010C0C106|nr:Smr/MutS family protein [Rhodobacter sp. SY28-1]
MARRRHLSPEEADLWRSVARTARPLHNQPLHLPDPPPAPALPPLAHAKPRLSPFTLGEKHRAPEKRDLAPTLPDLLGQAPLRMDANTHAKMTRGKLQPEARIDLHGMTLAEAHPELIRFILNAQSQGLRLVLVITGKGKRREDTGPIPQRMGALRHQVPHWLHLPPLGPAVLQVSEAHLKHGGGGAYYVYLRRR